MVKAGEELRVQRRILPRGPAKKDQSISQDPYAAVRVRRWEKPSWPMYGEIGTRFRVRNDPAKPNPSLKELPSRTSEGSAKAVGGFNWDESRAEYETNTKTIPDVRATKHFSYAPRAPWARKFGTARLNLFSHSAYPIYVGPQRPVKDE